MYWLANSKISGYFLSKFRFFASWRRTSSLLRLFFALSVCMGELIERKAYIWQVGLFGVGGSVYKCFHTILYHKSVRVDGYV